MIIMIVFFGEETIIGMVNVNYLKHIVIIISHAKNGHQNPDFMR